MTHDSVLEELARTRVVAIVRAQDSVAARELGAAIIDGGLPVLEVSLNTPGAIDAIRALSDEGRGVIGAGTVLDVADVARVAKAGATFMVTPNLNSDVVRAGLDHGLVVGPGVFTATECHQAMELGAHLLKLFPAANAGISLMKALGDPFPGAVWLPTGGISLENMSDWLRAGALAVGVGSALTGRGPEAAMSVAQQVRGIVAALREPGQQEGM
jgi:2-dehydro-3-deoxyphosphogluconate aldolase/(4S)-4-hydroxy-2-oxoglutarate aldolase